MAWESAEEALEHVQHAVLKLDGITESLAHEEDPQTAALSRAADLIMQLIEDCSAVSITVLDGSEPPRTAASTADWATELDCRQYRLDDGPCLDAARRQIVQRVDFHEARQRWHDFTAAATDVGVASFLSAGFSTGDRMLGSVNLYGAGDHAFDSLDEAVTALVTRHASLALSTAQQLDASRDLARQMEAALHTRPVIDWAIGILMGQTPCTAERAFEILRAVSQRRNVKLRDVAAEIVERAERRSKPTSG